MQDPQSADQRIGRVCVFCQRSHKKCDGKRPCDRCIRANRGHECGDPPVRTQKIHLCIMEPRQSSSGIVRMSTVTTLDPSNPDFHVDDSQRNRMHPDSSPPSDGASVSPPSPPSFLPHANSSCSGPTSSSRGFSFSSHGSSTSTPASLSTSGRNDSVSSVSTTLSNPPSLPSLVQATLEKTISQMRDMYPRDVLLSLSENELSGIDTYLERLVPYNPLDDSFVDGSPTVPTYVCRAPYLHQLLHADAAIVAKMATMIRVNRAFTSVFGWSSERLVEFQVAPPTLIHSEDLLSCLGNILLAWLAAPDSAEIVEFRHPNTRFMRLDGQFVHCFLRGVMLRSPNGIGVYNVVQLHPL